MTAASEAKAQGRPTFEVELERLASRVRDLESVKEIEDLHRTFVRAVADREFDGLEQFFTDDATIDMRSHGPKTGRTAIREHFSHMADVPLDGAGYVLSSPVVEVTGDSASAVWTWHRFHSQAIVAGQPTRVFGVWQEGRYHCEYRRVDVGWLISRMHFRVVRPDLDPEHLLTGETS
jgi:uncharacterized protein (TIGR02246 family)